MSNSTTQVSTIEQKVEELVTETITLKLNVKEDVENLENLEIRELLNLAKKAEGDGNKELSVAICQKLLERIKDKKLDLKSIELSYPDLFNIIMVAKAADNQELLDMSCQEVADRIKGKKPEEVREIFNIENDFTPEEEAAVREENAWAFEE